MSVLSVSKSSTQGLSKSAEPYIYLLKNQGVKGDIHCTPPNTPNLRQVHLIEAELFQDLAKTDGHGRSYHIYAGDLGENITTFGIRLSDLKKGSKIYFGDDDDGKTTTKRAVVEVTGLRCAGKGIEQRFRGLLNRFAFVGIDRKVGKVRVWKREVGVMGVVVSEGYVLPKQRIYVEQPKHGKALGYI